MTEKRFIQVCEGKTVLEALIGAIFYYCHSVL